MAVAKRSGAAPALSEPLRRLRNARYLKYAGDLIDSPAGHIVDLAMTPVDASATDVRQLLGAAPDSTAAARLAALVPPTVLDYIRSHHLYAGPHGH